MTAEKRQRKKQEKKKADSEKEPDLKIESYLGKPCILKRLMEDPEFYRRTILYFKETMVKHLEMLREVQKETGVRSPHKYIPKEAILAGKRGRLQEYANRENLDPDEVNMAYNLFMEGIRFYRYTDGRMRLPERKNKGKG